jgi:hypothetical protein
MGCASGKDAGPRNIFGNKYGQPLAAVQIARERRLEAKEKARRAQEEEEVQNKQAGKDSDDDDESDEEEADKANKNNDDDDDAETDDEDDYGPAPQAGIWAASEKLQDEALEYYDDDAETDDEEEEGPVPGPPVKKTKVDD